MGLVQNPELFRCGIRGVGVTHPGPRCAVHGRGGTDKSWQFGDLRPFADPVSGAGRLTGAPAQRLRQHVPLVAGAVLRGALKAHRARLLAPGLAADAAPVPRRPPPAVAAPQPHHPW